MCDKMAISAYILKIIEKDPCLRLQKRAKEMFNRDQLFSTNKQYVKIKLKWLCLIFIHFTQHEEQGQTTLS